MYIHPDRIKLLLLAYSNKTATAAEEQELLNWVAAGKAEEQTILHIRQLLEHTSPAEEFTTVDWERIYNKILEQRNHTLVTPSHFIGNKRGTVKYMAAAAILMVIALGAWFWQREGAIRQTTKTTVLARSEEQTESRSVTLLLSNGQVQKLDSNSSGTITEPGCKIDLSDTGISYHLPAERKGAGTYYNTLTVPRGRQYEVTLPDGTHVWLNAESSLRFPVAFTGDKREVALSGEGYFDVKPNSTLPFLVNAGHVKVRVLGTGFNVMAYKDEGVIATTLVNGSVQVASTDSVIIRPGEQALANVGQKISIQAADLDRVLAWKSGEFSFDGLTIKGIMRQLVRWYDIEVAYEGTMPSNEFYGIFPRKGNASQILDALELTGHIHFKSAGNKILVISGPPES
jgi:hypothetical protein